VEKISEFPLHGLQDMNFQILKNPFLGPAKTQAVALHKHTFIQKNVQNGGASLESFFKASWLHARKISDYLELYNI